MEKLLKVLTIFANSQKPRKKAMKTMKETRPEGWTSKFRNATERETSWRGRETTDLELVLIQ